MNEKVELEKRNHIVGRATVHLVWIPKRRKKVLIGKVKNRLAVILAEVAAENEFIIRSQEISPDHIHLLVEHSSRYSICEVVRLFKGRSSRLLRDEFPELRKIPTLWTRSYFYETTGKVNTERIREYIEDPRHY